MNIFISPTVSIVKLLTSTVNKQILTSLSKIQNNTVQVNCVNIALMHLNEMYFFHSCALLIYSNMYNMHGGGGFGTHWHQQSNIEHVDIINVRVLEENENVALPLDTSSTDRGSFLRHFDILFDGKFRYITRKERIKLQPYHKAEEH